MSDCPPWNHIKYLVARLTKVSDPAGFRRFLELKPASPNLSGVKQTGYGDLVVNNTAISSKISFALS